MDPSWWAVAIAGLFVGFVVGMTGMGGGALMTPMMILLFGIQPLAAVSSDLVASMVMKPVGGAVHLRRGTVNRSLVKWLVIGSVPSAFAGVLVLRWIGNGAQTQGVVKNSLGIALLFAAASMIAKALLDLRKSQQLRLRAAAGEVVETQVETIVARPVPTLLVGILGGLVVGMTSVGSGSLIIVALLLLYPSIRAGQLVGTDLVQAVPLVASASLGHLLFGDFQLDLTVSLLIGALPGVWVGRARVQPGPRRHRAPGPRRRAARLGLKLLGASTTTSWSWLLASRSSARSCGPPSTGEARPDRVDTSPRAPDRCRGHRPLLPACAAGPRPKATGRTDRVVEELTERRPVTSRGRATRPATRARRPASSRCRARGRTRCRRAAGRRSCARRRRSATRSRPGWSSDRRRPGTASRR
jgi:uncharacterized membrane protein YfcA